MTLHADLEQLSTQQLRALTADLLQRVAHQEKALTERDQTIRHHEVLNEKLMFELAVLKRHRFGRRSETLCPEQGSLLDELFDTDIAAIEAELEQQALSHSPPAEKKRQAKRTPLPAEFPRTVITHEPEHTHCGCGCAYTPGEFSVERHIRGKWVCDQRDTLTQAPVPPQVIGKGIPTTGLLAHVLVAKYMDHLSLYRQERIFARAGHAIPRSTLADWVGRCGVELQPLVDALRNRLLQEAVLHGDETVGTGQEENTPGVCMGLRQHTREPIAYEFRESRSGKHARAFLQDWQGKLVCDDFSCYKAGFKQGITKIACCTQRA